jgi:hypothetical protein
MIKVDEVAASLDKALVEEKKMFERIKRMSEVRMTPQVKELVMRALFDIDSTIDLSKDDAVSTVTRNKIIKYDIDHRTEVAQKGDNLWGLFSGVTRFTTHTATKNDTESKLFGVYAGRERKIFNELAALVN